MDRNPKCSCAWLGMSVNPLTSGLRKRWLGSVMNTFYKRTGFTFSPSAHNIKPSLGRLMSAHDLVVVTRQTHSLLVFTIISNGLYLRSGICTHSLGHQRNLTAICDEVANSWFSTISFVRLSPIKVTGREICNLRLMLTPMLQPNASF